MLERVERLMQEAVDGPVEVGRRIGVQLPIVLLLRFGFGSVPADSRCPKGETCIWEGDAGWRAPG